VSDQKTVVVTFEKDMICATFTYKFEELRFFEKISSEVVAKECLLSIVFELQPVVVGGLLDL
ncbi:unnamed protein product, partial [Sphenostylis stenocarpa]